MKSKIDFAKLKFDSELQIWICECGAKYGTKKPNPNWCMKCHKEWLNEDCEM